MGRGISGRGGAGRGWRAASGFLGGNGVGKSMARRDVQKTHRRDGELCPGEPSGKPGFTVRLQKSEGTSNQNKMVAGLFVSPLAGFS